MPRKTPSTNTTSAAATLNNLSHPYPTPSTSPLLVPTLPLPLSPVPVLGAPITLKTPNQHHVHDSTLSLPIGTTLNIPRKNGSSRIGQSILGQLLAAHKPGRDHHKLANDATLSLETIRPKEQQRRSILPTSWTMGFSKSSSMQGLSLSSPPGKTAGSALTANRNVMKNAEQNERQHAMLPSAWLENVLSRLSRSDLHSAPHYATMPRVGLQEQKRPQLQRMFTEQPMEKKGEGKDSSKTKPASPTTMNPKSKAASLKPQTLSRKSSICEVALGDDARELFQQNRPKTLSSAVISSSIVPAMGPAKPTRNGRQHSMDAVMTLKSANVLPANMSESLASSCPPASTSTTRKTTRGRFTIESSSAAPIPLRTRTLSCTAGTAPPGHPQHQQILNSFERPALSLSPASPTALTFSLPPSSMDAIRPPSFRSMDASVQTSPPLSPPPQFVNTQSVDGASNSSTSTPIVIPRGGRPSHQRTHSNSSVQSCTSASSRRSQVIIPPPPSASSLQFASFSSIASCGGAGVSGAKCSNAAAPPPLYQQHQPQRRPPPNNSNSSNNNFRNLSIQIVPGDKNDAGLGSHDGQLFHLDTPIVHPLDEGTNGQESKGARDGPTQQEMQTAHQTMNRVHPSQDLIDSPREFSAPMTTCSTSSSSVSSMSSSLGNCGVEGGSRGTGGYERNSQGAGYFRQRSLSATNFNSQRLSGHSSNNHSIQQQQPTESAGFWTERTARRTHGSVSNAGHQCRSSTPPVRGPSDNALPVSSYGSSHGEISDVVMIKKSAKGRTFTVERTIPASPTRSSRFIVGSSTDELFVPAPPQHRTSSPLHN
ncbi:hypothetical protein EDD21DRAFT_2058 [Dissophora ornata]|nr:hypothetical protein BGZ58_010388 [Dissophora ornata]KAI8596492.1 hypothetical protein EDD21DRAFT_2058 [Dissophora ornata]